VLEHMRDAGQVLATTAPANFDYYRRLGWDWTCVTRQYRATTRVLPVDPETDKVRAATKADQPGIETMYARFAEGYRGMSARDSVEWDMVLDSSKEHASYVYLYEGDEGIEGYLVVCGGNADETSLPEFLAITPRAQRALLGLLHRLHMQTKVFVWDAPEDDGLWSNCMHREIETTLRPVIQCRVVDVAAALGALRPAESIRESFTMEIHDPLSSWNVGVWRVEVEGGTVSARLTQEKAHIRMDIQALSQAFFGSLSVAALRKRERIEVRGEPAFQALARLLDGPPMWANGPI
jgi:predicted acetyltransferase